MRKGLIVTGIVLLCLPTVFVLWLFTAARCKSLDTITMRLPQGLREPVAQIEMNHIRFQPDLPGVQRVLRLDPSNSDAWRNLCRTAVNASPAERLETCKKSVSMSDTAAAESDMGDAELAVNDSCAAENAYRRATSLDAVANSARSYNFRAGYAALQCGELEEARASFAAALFLDEKVLHETGDDAQHFTAKKIASDHAYLSLTLQREGRAPQANDECRAVHPEWKRSCACAISEQKHLKCSGQ